jgi:hypothetical protein
VDECATDLEEHWRHKENLVDRKLTLQLERLGWPMSVASAAALGGPMGAILPIWAPVYSLLYSRNPPAPVKLYGLQSTYQVVGSWSWKTHVHDVQC